jgi:hypothetical protein
VAAVLGWILPGLGQVYVGRPLKGTLFFAAILPTFLLGWTLSGFKAVDPGMYGLDFAGQVFCGGPTACALLVGSDHVLEHMPRFFEVGRLYVTIAGLLNLVAVCDAVGEAITRDRELLQRRIELAHLEPTPETDPERDFEPDLHPTPDPAPEPTPGPFPGETDTMTWLDDEGEPS